MAPWKWGRMLAPDRPLGGFEGARWTGKSFSKGVGRTTVKYRDDGWLQIVNNLKALDQSRVQVGVVGADARKLHPSGLSMVDIAAINEFGTDDGHVPSRSFLRSVLRSQKSWEGLRAVAASATRQMVSRKNASVARALDAVGRWAVAEIKNAIANTVPPPQAEATIAKKGHDGTLRETFSLYDAINYRITTWATHAKAWAAGDDSVDTKVLVGTGDTNTEFGSWRK